MSVVHVQLFASLRDIAGEGDLQVELGRSATVGDLLAELERRHPALAGRLNTTAVAVNRRIAGPLDPVGADDEVALLPPVSGG